MSTGEINSTITLAGITAGSRLTRTDSGVITHDPVLPAGKSGSLTTRTDDDTGVATLASGHGITTADKVDVYWSGGMRYGCSVTLVATDDVTIDLGAGDVLPAVSTALIVTPRVELDTDFSGDLASMLVAVLSKRGHIEFTTGADASIKAVELNGDEAWNWVSGQGIANPLAGGAIGKIQATCGEAASALLKLAVLYDSTV